MKPRKPADPEARLRSLQAARAKAVEGDIVNAADMAKVLGMTWRNLKLTLEADSSFPVISRGAEGIPWQFDAVAVIDHMIAGCEAVMADRETRQSRLRRLSGLSEAEGAQDGSLTASEAKQIAEAQMTVHKLKMAQGRYMPKEQVTAFLHSYHGKIQSDLLTAAARIDPAGQLPPDVRRRVEDLVRTMLVELRDDLGRFVDQHRVEPAS